MVQKERLIWNSFQMKIELSSVTCWQPIVTLFKIRFILIFLETVYNNIKKHSLIHIYKHAKS